jgi:hypothetical protein
VGSHYRSGFDKPWRDGERRDAQPLNEQADKNFATPDAVAERIRKVGAATLQSIGQIARRQAGLRPPVARGVRVWIENEDAAAAVIPRWPKEADYSRNAGDRARNRRATALPQSADIASANIETA